MSDSTGSKTSTFTATGGPGISMHSEEIDKGPWVEIVLSLFRVGAFLLKNRRVIGICTLVGLALGLGIAFARTRHFTATASFMPQSGGDANSSLKSLAGQFGIPISAANAAESPAFYQDLVTSRLILAPIAAGTFETQAGVATSRKPLIDLMDIASGSPQLRAEKGTEKLQKSIGASSDKETGVVTISVSTPWRAVSLAVASQILQAVNDFNLKTRQSQASAERKFVETRLALATQSLRSAENDMQSFLEHNRDLGAPRVRFDQDRLQRKVALQQQVVSTLSQSLEDAQLREVRDTPVITTIQAPAAKVEPDPRRAGAFGLLGLLTGAIVGVAWAMFRAVAGMLRLDANRGLDFLSEAVGETPRDLGRLDPHKDRSAQ